MTLRLDRAVTYTANLRYVLHVEPVAGTVRAAVGPTAEAAMLSTDLKDVSDAFPGLVAEVTDAEGKVMVSSETLYIKWTDAEGKVLDLQSARLVVRDGDNVPGNYDTQTRTETKDVNLSLIHIYVRPEHPQRQSTTGRPLRRHQLHGTQPEPAGVRTVRLCGQLLYRGAARRQGWTVRDRPRRHGFPG